MQPQNTYDACAEQYEAWVSRRDEVHPDSVEKYFFDVIGDVKGLKVLDAGCGEGFVSRVLRRRGASVTGVDVASKLVAMAKEKSPEDIDFLVSDLSRPLPQFENTFDLIASLFVLNDVPDYKGFISTLSAVTKPGGRAVLLFNNPYSAVYREKADSYFDADTVRAYGGMGTIGIDVYHYHRLMSEYVNTFSDNGFLLRRLVDIPPGEDEAEERRVGWQKVAFIIVVEFVKTDFCV